VDEDWVSAKIYSCGRWLFLMGVKQSVIDALHIVTLALHQP